MTSLPPPHAPVHAPGGGSHGLEGYYYQALVSVWVAVDLLLVTEAAERVQLEPVSQEDLEADLTSPSAPVVGVAASAQGYRLKVQVKSTTGEPWNMKTFRAIMQHGGTQRQAARDVLLNDAQSRYLLITNNVAVNTLRSIVVPSIGVWPTDAELPSLWSSEAPAGAEEVSKRVAMITGADEERVIWKLQQHLTSVCHIPMSRWKECLKALHLEALRRMRPNSDHDWRRSDLEEIIREFGGYLSSSLLDSQFVKPQTWLRMVDQLTNQYVILIKGESGTGKTTSARALIAHLREKVGGIEEVLATTPSAVRDFKRRPVVFYLDDPWGKSRFEPDAEPWRNELPSLLQMAGPDTFFVVTTRSDVFQSAGLESKHTRWIVPLESSDYAPHDRFDMYRNRLPTLNEVFRPLVAARRGTVLEKLKSPYEIDQFFSGLIGINPAATAEEREEQISDAVQSAHIDAIQGNIKKQIGARNAGRWAIVLWAALQVSESVSREMVRRLQNLLARRDKSFEDDHLDELISFLGAGKTLRLSQGIVSFGHPQAAAALRSIVIASPVVAQSTLRSISDALVAMDDREDRPWAAEALAKLSASLPKSIDKLEVFEATNKALMNQWLERQCLTGTQDFEDALRTLARAGTQDFVPSNVARFLVDLGVYSHFNDAFVPFQPDEDWLKAAASHRSTQSLCHRYIASVLPFANEAQQDDFIEILERIAGDLTSAFLEPLQSNLGNGLPFPCRQQVIEASCRNLDLMKPIAADCLQRYQRVDTSISPEEEFGIADCWYGGDYAADIAFDAWEYASFLSDCLEHYVGRAREVHGWRAFSEDETSRGMERWWLEALSKQAGAGVSKADPEEVVALWVRTENTPSEARFWSLAEPFWTDHFAGALVDRLVDREIGESVRREALHLACSLDREPLLENAVRELQTQCNWSGLLDFLTEIKRVKGEFPLEEPLARALNAIEAPHRELFSTILSSASGRPEADHTLPQFIGKLSPKSDFGLLALIQAKVDSGLDPAEEVRGLLNRCQTGDAPSEAIRYAGRCLPLEQLHAATRHKFGKVKSAAANALEARGVKVDNETLLMFAENRSQYAKEAALEIARSRPEEAKCVLQKLLYDVWTEDHWDFFDHSVFFPFAEGAANALYSHGLMSGDDERSYLEAAFATRSRRVRLQLFEFLVCKGSRDSRMRLMEVAVERQPVVGKIEAASAIALHVAAIELDVANVIQIAHLIELDAAVSTRLAKIAGRHIDEPKARELAEALRADPERRILLLPMGIGAAARPTLKAAIAGMLPTKHPAHGVFGPARKDIPPQCLASLGGHAEVRAIRGALSDWFEPEQDRISPYR
ncbi:hypothetical protein ACS5PN_17120 [Roseateles sp. NT4]|uniref:nSTAND3 domain-containing NTPase n=1 Tax=Roseateles sp. NT4 TaxID=3453715 RepID=UPI003EEC838C